MKMRVLMNHATLDGLEVQDGEGLKSMSGRIKNKVGTGTGLLDQSPVGLAVNERGETHPV